MINLSQLLKPAFTALVVSVLPLAAQAAPQSKAHTVPVVSALQAGSLLSVQAQQPAVALQHAGQRFLITYRSRGVHGEPIIASGFVLLPKGAAPKQGWPVLAWAHGTTGVADTCAPSGNYPNGPVDDYQQVANNALDTWLERGYAIVAPDYQGLGTPGGHPYMNAASQLHTVVDAVRAVHMLKPKQISKQWLVMGHSQGGAAALAVAAHGQKDAPELTLRGAIALAPGGYDYAGIAQYTQNHPNPEPSVAAFFPIVLLGAQAADPDINPDVLVSSAMQPILNRARGRCLSELQTELKQSPEHIFKADANLKPLLAYLKQQSIERMTPTVPLMLVQGHNDQLVDARGTQAYYQQLCKAGKPVIFQLIKEGSHRDALKQSPVLSAEFLNKLNSRQVISSCS